MHALLPCGPGCEQGNWPERSKMLSKTASSPHTARNILPVHNSTWSLHPATSTLADTEAGLEMKTCIAVFFTLDAGMLARSQYSEGPVTDHLDTGLS